MTVHAARAFLSAGIVVPLLYFGTHLVAGGLTPDYSHVSQYGSELGIAGAPAARLFNGGILLTAVATILGAVGLYLGARRASPGRLWPALTGLSLGLFGVGLVFGGLFPMPDPRHGGFGLGMAVHAAPVFLALALRRAPGHRNLMRFSVVAAVLMLAFLAVMMGVGGLLTRANVGLFQRIYALTLFGWIGIAAFGLRRSVRADN